MSDPDLDELAAWARGAFEAARQAQILKNAKKSGKPKARGKRAVKAGKPKARSKSQAT